MKGKGMGVFLISVKVEYMIKGNKNMYFEALTKLDVMEIEENLMFEEFVEYEV